MNIQKLLSKRISKALISAGVKENFDPKIRQASKPKFGHYQADGIIVASKKLGISSRELAERVLTHLDLIGIASKIEIEDPGFINIFLDPNFLASNIDEILKKDVFFTKKPKSTTIIVDYSSPNIAKEMHVGHLRSTIIGDSVVRTLKLLGYKVIRANHIGDWGTQFGMLIAWLEKKQIQSKEEKIELSNLEDFYQEAKENYEKDKIFAELARSYVVKLQNGDNRLLKLWKKLVDITMIKNQDIYDRLNVTMTTNDIIGESFYNSMLPGIVSDLKSKGLAVESEGAIVVFLDEFKNKTGKPIGVIIQKKDGGYLYTTTDIACVKYRYEKLHADRILYYVDSRQRQHLIQALAIARKAGYVPNSVSLEHHVFGMVLNKDGKPFKTRSGSTIKLSNLLDEALERATNLITKKNPNMPINQLKRLANSIGIGAIKYADLSKNRTTDYIFDWDTILSFEGNTALYIQYAYARIFSLFQKSNINEISLNKRNIVVSTDFQENLAALLMQFEEKLELVARDGAPNVMCLYLYNVAVSFSRFYENYPILSVNSEEIRNSHLKLSLLTAKILKLGLETLGIDTVEHI